MKKTKEELNTLKQEYETLNNKLKELTEDELNMITGGTNLANIIGGIATINTAQVIIGSALSQKNNTADKETEPGIPAKAA